MRLQKSRSLLEKSIIDFVIKKTSYERLILKVILGEGIPNI